MKKEFTRKELIHSAVKKIRIILRCVEDEYGRDDDKMFRLLRRCSSIASVLEDLDVISLEDSLLLKDIIDREYEKMLGRKCK